ncbi:sugar ABC transporter permease [Chloroflexia bacterium SDU3-3]|nr:sugar ABC transporter permease [Chloroflexia bacterium SDU3-3]
MRSSNTSQPVAIPAQARRGRRVNVEKIGTVTLFLLPAAIIYTIFVLMPVVQAAYYSFFKWNGLGSPTNFVGLDNFIRIFSDKVFQGALLHNIVIVVLSIAIQLPLALGLALLVNKGLRGKTVFRTLFFLPYVLSDVVTGVIWNFIYKADGGLLNSILSHLIPGFTAQGWLGNPKTVLVALFVVMTWKYFGLHLLLFLAALQDVPVELEEAAAIDGATSAQITTRIIIPLMGSTARLAVYLSALGSIQIFDLVWVMTTGGPVNASETMATYMYKYGFQRFSIGYGSSVAIAIFIFCLGFSMIYQFASKQRD